MRITCTPRESTRMLDPTASSTSTDSVFLSSQGRAWKAYGLEVSAPDGAEVDDVARHLGVHRLLNVGANLQVVATTGGAHVLDTGDVVGVADAARALDASRHDRLDERAEVLVFDRTLALDLVEARSIGQSSGWLASRNSITPSRALATSGVSVKICWPGMAGNAHDASGFGAPLRLDEAHATVSGNHESLVVTKPRNLSASLLAGLDEGGALLDFDLFAVDGELDHLGRGGGGGGLKSRGGGGEGGGGGGEASGGVGTALGDAGGRAGGGERAQHGGRR
ncbi:hypothetical protein L1887_53677 [Cichorium endivia]|nr:hypothetical protein L1887_53677 [Cichorium endivia]